MENTEYEKKFLELQNIAYRYCMNNYDYCYLSAMHHKNRTEGTKTIITGSSHSMNGIIESVFTDRPINFSISSQDLFYDYQHIRKAVKEGLLKIETCIVTLGYYTLYQDLSLSLTWGRQLIPRVYVPLFDEPHHLPLPYAAEYDRYQALDYDREKYPDSVIRSLCEEWPQNAFTQWASYYNPLLSREHNSKLFLDGYVWQEMSAQERESVARKRAEEHNRHSKYLTSRLENGLLLGELVHFLTEEKIRPIFVIFPFSAAYNQHINPEFRKDIYGALDSLLEPVEFLDMNDLGAFDDTDFVDADHLNMHGAEKASHILQECFGL